MKRHLSPLAVPFCVLLTLMLMVGAAHAQAVIALDSQHTARSIWPDLQVYEDPSTDLSASQVASLPTSHWSSLDSRHQHFGIGNSAFWARFSLRLRKPDEQAWYILHEQFFVDQVQLFQQQADGFWQPIKGLRDSPDRWFSGSRNPAFPVQLSVGETAQFLVRTQTRSQRRFPLSVLSARAYLQHERKSSLFSGLVLAVPMSVALFIILLWRIQRDRGLLIVFGLIVSELIGAAWAGGVLYMVVPDMSPRVQGLLGMLGWSTLLVFAHMHARHFLNLDQDFPRAVWFFRITPVIVVICMMQELAGLPAARNVLIYACFVSVVAFFVASVWQTLRGLRYAWIYVLAWSTYLVSTSLLVVNLLGAIPPNASNQLLFVQGSIVSLLFAIAAVGHVRERENKHLRLESELRAAKHQTEQAMAERSRLFAATNHDLRQPLQSLGMFIELTQRQSQDDKIQRWTRQMHAACLNMSDTVDGLLALSRLDSQALEVELSDWPLNDLLRTLAEEYQLLASGKGVALDWVACSVWVRSDRHLLDRLLRNLVANAVRYTQKGRVLIGVRRKGDDVDIQIWDTGSGIDADSQERIFQPYERGEAGLSRGDGLGLGLAIVQGLAEALNHAVELRTWPGKGSCFAVRVPQAKARPKGVA